MPLTLLAQDVKTGLLDVVEFDTVISEQHQADLEVTEHPVEQGGKIVDHVRAKPLSLTFEALISNTPLRREDRADSGRAEAALARLQEFKAQGRLVQARTTLRQYDDMVLTSLATPRDAKSGDALRFSVTLKQVRVVSSQRVKVDPKSVKTERAIPRVDKGKQEAQPAKNQSILFSSFGFGDWLKK